MCIYFASAGDLLLETWSSLSGHVKNVVAEGKKNDIVNVMSLVLSVMESIVTEQLLSPSNTLVGTYILVDYLNSIFTLFFNKAF